MVASSTTSLADTHGRHFEYLRLSLTDVCNFRCTYCLPNGYKSSGPESFLSQSEISHLLAAFSELGITKVRLTGGEPTVRPDILSVVNTIAQLNGIKKVALTTNGYRLDALAGPLREAGLTHINVSVDSLDEDNFQKITGKPLLKKILTGIDNALEVGFEAVKINIVFLKDLNDFELPGFVEFVRRKNVSIRFIELMATGHSHEYFRKHFLSTRIIESCLRDKGWNEVAKRTTDGPAIEFSHPDYVGRIGMITPTAQNFCKSCNRLRVSSRGGLQLCLFGEGQYNLRPFLASANQKENLKQKIAEALFLKPRAHDLESGAIGTTHTLSMIGG
ncbi:MAG: GTP 3',8-cyclase MoaA [Bdellovibrionaceae bacterium]|nr:GTP 3',8-cyclase MoaA [Pseudobdellovibrionaceae bacterium]